MTQAIRLAFEGTPIDVRIVPHVADPSCVMLKFRHPEAGLALCSMAGIQCGVPSQGSHYFMVEVDREELTGKLSELLTTLFTQSAATVNPPLTLVPDKCPECGTDDGTHYVYCGESTKEN